MNGSSMSMAGREGFYRLNALDILLVGVILAGASGVLLFTGLGLNWGGAPPSEASVYLEGRRIQRLDLERDGQRSLALAGGAMKIEVENGRIRVLESNCTNRICIHAGWIERPGEMIACVPNRIMIEIEREQENFLDAIVE